MQNLVRLSQAFAVFGLVATCYGVDRLVPSQYPTIQAAIDASRPGDVVQVSPGLYSGPVDFLGKSVVVRGTSADPALTTVSGGESVVRFLTAETSSSRLENLTITNGAGLTGAGIRIVGASPVIKNCRVVMNSATGGGVCRGGGIAVLGGSPLIDGCLVGGNSVISGGGPAQSACASTWVVTSNGYGGGIFISNAAVTIRNTTISGNLVRGSASSGCNASASVVAIGGGLYKIGPEALVMINTNVSTNVIEASASATCNQPCCAAFAGAAFIEAPASLAGCRFTNNSRTGCGGNVGGVRFEGTGTTLAGTRICENSEVNYSGAYIDAGGNSVSETCPSCAGDVNGDGRVDGVDVATVLGAWGTCP